MAVPYKAPVKDIVFGYEVIDSYNILNKISAFSDFSEDIVIPTMEECAKSVSYTHLTLPTKCSV